jgi:hypothetical protein
MCAGQTFVRNAYQFLYVKAIWSPDQRLLFHDDNDEYFLFLKEDRNDFFR